MSFQPNELTIANLVGNVSIPRNLSPIIRASVRRTDASGSFTEPYYPGISGKSLTFEYTDTDGVVQAATATFLGDSYLNLLTEISGKDSANVEAIDMDGFLALKNRNSGGTHYLKIIAQGDPANDAAIVLGLTVDPYPGSVSYAGELVSTPGVRRQNNPQGTALIGKDEDLSSEVFNRALLGVINYFETYRTDLDREVAVVKDVIVTLANNHIVAVSDGIPGGSQSTVANVFTINDPNLRIPIGFVSGISPSGTELEEIFKMLEVVSGPPVKKTDLVLQQTVGGGRYRVKSVHYSSAPTTGDFRNTASSSFLAWGSPDDKSIFGVSPTHAQKAKHPTIAISAVISGNVLSCAGATFVTLHVQPGDTVRITGAANGIPFNHNGEYVVSRVIDETRVQVRAKSSNEPLVWSTSNRPTELNPNGGFGSLTIPIGFYLPASSLVFTLEHVGGSSWGLLTSYADTVVLRLKTGTPMRLAAAQALAAEFNVSPDAVLSYIEYHIASGGHPASAISWNAAQPTWARTAETISGTDLQAILISLIGMLGDNETSTSAETGASRIGSAALTAAAPNAGPNTLAAGSVKSQLLALLGDLNAHVSDGTAHSGGGGTSPYSGSGPWQDDSVITPGITLDAAIDGIVAALGKNNSGSSKISVAARSDWGNSPATTNPGNVSLTEALNKIIVDLKSTASATEDGAAKVGAFTLLEAGAAVPGNSVRSQLNYIASNWARTSRANTWTAAQTFNGDTSGGGLVGANLPVMKTDTPQYPRRLLWEMNFNSTQKIRLFYSADGFEVTLNANILSGTVWAGDVTPSITNPALRYQFRKEGFAMQKYQGDLGASWSDVAWISGYQQFLITTQPASGISAASPNTFTATQTMNGALGSDSNTTRDTSAALVTNISIIDRKLLWQMPYVGTVYMRLYSGPSGIEYTQNARWNGTAWQTDNATNDATRTIINYASRLIVQNVTTPGSSFADATFWAHTLFDSNALVKANAVNHFTATQYLEGATAADAALITTQTPNPRKLLWEANLGNQTSSGGQVCMVKFRMYATATGIEIAVNAYWDNPTPQWMVDCYGKPSWCYKMSTSGLSLYVGGFLLSSDIGVAGSGWVLVTTLNKDYQAKLFPQQILQASLAGSNTTLVANWAKYGMANPTVSTDYLNLTLHLSAGSPTTWIGFGSGTVYWPQSASPSTGYPLYPAFTADASNNPMVGLWTHHPTTGVLTKLNFTTVALTNFWFNLAIFPMV